MKFDHSHYVPILKGKKGELVALAKAENIREFTPLVEVIPVPLTYPEEGPAYPSKTIDEHVKDSATSFTKAMGILPSVFIDGLYIENEKLRDGSSAVGGLFSRLRSTGIRFIPTIGLDRGEAYTDAVRDAISHDKRGCCLRLEESDLESLSDLDKQINSLLKALNLKVSETHLLIDFRDKVPPKVTMPLLIEAFPRVDEWRSFIFSASSFPKTLGDVKKNTIEDFERPEWVAWIFLREKRTTANKRVPTYSDYGINHPDLIEDLDPRAITIAPNIRYTTEASYVVAKGQAQPRKKQAKTPELKATRANLAPSVQYPKLAKMIKEHPGWKTPSFSWGDKFIDRCSQNKCTGTGSDWRGVGASHHIALAVRQIASLP
jgi:Beta protein